MSAVLTDARGKNQIQIQIDSLQAFARNAVAQFSYQCQNTIDCQPLPEQEADYIQLVKNLLRHLNFLHAFTSDPDYKDQQIAQEIEGRRIQLEHILRGLKNPLADAAAAELEKRIFA